MRNIFKLRLIISNAVIRRNSHTFQRIADILNGQKQNDKYTSVKGWVRAIRKMKDNIFVDIDDGSSTKRLQVVVGKSFGVDIDYGCSVEAKGQLGEAPSGQPEMRAEEIKILGAGQLQEGYPFAPRKSYSPDYCRQYLHLRPRLAHYASVLRVRDAASLAFREFFKSHNYFEVHTPILTSNDCEGAGEVFKVSEEKTSKENEPFFDKNIYLTVSAQLHLEVVARSLSQVYCFAPTFRAENSKSRFHLAEFYMLEAETTLAKSLNDLTSFTEEMLRYVINSIRNTNEQDINLCRQRFSESKFKLEDSLVSKWTVMSYEEASKILSEHKSSLKVIHSPGTSLTKDHELFLTNFNGNKPIFIVDWPVNLKPFYMKINENHSNIVEAFDLLFPNVGEICGGSLRENDIKRLSTSIENYNGLEWYLDLRKFGNVLTGGFGLGFDRLLMSLLNISNIKDTIPFPRFPHHCQL
ncbi:hypothetical protein O3M35_004902 [Rhynocoris fuscipes]|uniref:asparagine--tRNA ligase n=1 Tax=Rhynocoris fuscipes TaxID=488301 RepID=A0AAW1DIN7_9HEMI